MDPQIQELIERMRELVATIAATSKTSTVGNGSDAPGGDAAKAFTRGSDKIVNAMATLAVKLEGKAKTTAAEERAVNKFADQVEKITETQDAAAKKIADAAKAAADALETAAAAAALAARTDQQIAADKRSANIKQLGADAQAARKGHEGAAGVWKDFEDLGSGSQLLKDKFMSLGGNSMTAQIGLQALSAGAEGVVKSLAGFGSALDKGQRGAAVGAQALSDLATPLLDFADTIGKIITFGSFFVPGGALVKGAVAAGGALLSLGSSAGKLSLEYVKVSAAAADALFKSFNSLSQAGATTAGGMDDVFAQLQTLGMTLSEIDKFTTLIGKNSKILSQFGATAAEGAKAFSEVAGTLVKSDLGRQLAQLGITADEQRESALAYMNIQAKTGQLNLKNTKQLIEESGKFAKELDLAARLTGTTRKEQEAAREAAMSEVRFRAALIDAEQRGDKEQLAALEVAQRMAAIAKSMGDERGFTGILQNAAAGGAASTPEGIAAQQSYNVQAAILEAAEKGSISDARLLEIMAAQTELQQKSLAGTNRFIGGIDTLQTNIVAQNDLLRRNAAISKGAAEAGFTGPNAREEFLKTEQGKRVAEANKPGSTTGAMVDADRAQQSAAMMMDSAKAVGMAAEVNQRASTAFAEAVKMFGETVGAKQPTGGTYSNATPGATGTATALGTTPALTDRGKQAATPALSPAEKAQTAAITDAKAKAQPLIAATAAARKSQEAAQVEVDRLEKANISGAALVAAKAKLAAAAEESEKAQAASNAAEIDIRRQTADLAKDQLQQKLMYNQWLEKNIRESRKIGEEIITDETTKKSYAFDEVKLMSKDLDNYERYVKRKEQLTAAELNDIKTTRGSEATSNEKKEVETRARAQAQREFAQVAVAATGPATRGTPNPTGAAQEIPYVQTAPAPAPKAPAAPSADTAPRTTALGGAPASSLTGNSPLADLISRGESASSGNYNAANSNGGTKRYSAGEKNLTGMTIGDLQKSQESGDIFAAGRYQIVPKTMKGAVQTLGLKSTDKFDQAMQDRIFNEYLTGVNRPEIQSFLSGDKKADVDAAVLALAKEFASVGVPSSMQVSDDYGKRQLNSGDGYYSGVGANPTGAASITPEQARAALTKTRDQMKASVAGSEPTKMALGGVVKSTPGGVGVVAGEAGRNEAFVPLPDGKSIPVKQDTTVVKDVQNLSAQVSGLSKLIAGKMINQTGATDELGMNIKSSDVLAKLIRTIIPGLGMIEKIGGIGNTVAGVADTDFKMTGSDKVMEVVKLLVPQVRILAGIYDTISPFLKSDDNTATLAKRQMPVAPVDTSTTANDSDSTKATTALAVSISDLGKITGNNPLAPPNATAAPDWVKMESKLSATMSDFGNLAGTNTRNLGEIASPNIDRADVTSNNIGKLIDELKEQNKSNMKDAMSSVAGELKDAFKGMSPQTQDNSSSQELVAAVNEMVRAQRDNNAISSRILQVSQN